MDYYGLAYFFYAAILLAFLLVSVVVGLLLFAVSRFLSRKAPQDSTSKLTITKSLLIGVAIAAIGVIIFYIIPTRIKDNNWWNKQVTCAKEAGYAHPGDNNTNRATAESQDIYRECIEK